MDTLMDGPIYFYQLVYICILSAVCCSLPERFLGGPAHSLKLESYNFQHVLSWQAKSDPTLPIYYSVLYTDRRNWKTAEKCSNITQLSCNLTDDFKDVHTQYSVMVQSIIGTEVFNSSVLHFEPVTDTTEVASKCISFFEFCRGWQTIHHLDQNIHASRKDKTILGPPEVNISSCRNCINITIKLPASHLRIHNTLPSLIDIYEEVEYDIILKTPDGEHKRPRETTTEEIFSTIIEELYPNRNYCVSVMVAASINEHSIPSAWKCVTVNPIAQQDYQMVTVACAVCFSLMLAGGLKCLHAGGYILQNKSLPRTLVFLRTLTVSHWTLESIDIASVEIIYKEVKKKANQSSIGVSDGDDSSDSDSDTISNHDYTRREVISRAPHSFDTPNIFIQYSTNVTSDDSSSQASEKPEADPEDFEEHEMDIEDKDSGSELLDSFSEVNHNYSSGQRNSACFTINLNTVLLRTSEENTDSSAPLLSSQEDAVDWQCSRAFESKLLDDTGSVQKPHYQNGSHEWQNSSHSSDESDSSDSEMDPKNEYIRR